MDAGKTGRFIAGLRRERGMTQAELAEKLHVTDKAVSKWERGAGLPDIASLEPLAAALGVTVSELLRGEAAGRENGVPQRKRRNAYRIFRWVCFGLFAAAYLLYAGLWVRTAFAADNYGGGITETMRAALERRIRARTVAEEAALLVFSAGLWGAFAFTKRLKRVLTDAGWMFGLAVLAGGGAVAVIRLFTPYAIGDPILFAFPLLERAALWLCVFGVIILIKRRAGKQRDA